MSNLSEDEIDGLANRLAMLTGGDGEADNAGRAVAALARRLGLTGGQLKAMFLEGARADGAGPARLSQLTGRVQQLEQENTALRDTLGRAELAVRSLQHDRDTLEDEVSDLRAALHGRRGAHRTRGALAVLGAVAAAAVIVSVVYGPRLFVADRPTPTVDGAPQFQIALVRDHDIALRQDPALTAATVMILPVGSKLTVRRMLWRSLQQWIEVEIDGKTGYVLTTEVELS